MNQNNNLDTCPQLGYFLDYRFWNEALRLLEFQLGAKEKNKHFNTLEMFYYERLKEYFEELRDREYFKGRVANNLFYGLSKEFAIIPYIIPKSNLGSRRYKFMTCPMRLLYYAVGLYLLELSQDLLRYHEKTHKHIQADYGGRLIFNGSKLSLSRNGIWYKLYWSG